MKRCKLCNKRILPWQKKEGEYHLLCHKDLRIEMFKNHCDKLDKQLHEHGFMSIGLLFSYLTSHKNSNLKADVIVLSPHFKSELQKLQEYLQHKTTNGVITKLFGMQVVIDDNITGWYLK